MIEMVLIYIGIYGGSTIRKISCVKKKGKKIRKQQVVELNNEKVNDSRNCFLGSSSSGKLQLENINNKHHKLRKITIGC